MHPSSADRHADRSSTVRRRALAVFRSLLDAEQGEWPRLVDESCAADPALRAHVEALLRADRVEDAGLDQPVSFGGSDESAGEDELIGLTLGPFRVIERIGRGGMGTVYRAERINADFVQQVAIKVIRRGLDSDDLLKRFQRERRILASLSHPNLTRLIDAGLTPDGRPWLALDFVCGIPINAWCDQRRLDLRSRIVLMLEVIAAVQHAHERLIVHRDLKPGNVLVDEAGDIRLLDFGIATLLDADGDGDAHTIAGPGVGAVPLTPEYAAPEQLAGTTITAATDVYALGVMLYELLAGQLPVTFERRDWPTLQTAAGKAEPARLSHAITRPSPGNSPPPTAERLQRRRTSLAAFRRYVHGDLDRILGKALARDAALRYPTAQALADDLRRFLAGEPVRATGTRRVYRLRKFIARNRLGVSLGALSILLVVVGMAGVLWQSGKTAREAERALAASQRATAVTRFLTGLLTAANPFLNPGQTPTVRDLMDHAARSITADFGDRPDLAAELLGVVGASYRAMGEMTQAQASIRQAMTLIDQARLAPDVAAGIRTEYAHALLADNRVDEARDLAIDALAALPDDGPQHDDARIDLLKVLATARSLLGDAGQALADLQQATALACQETSDITERCISSLLELKYFHEAAGDSASALASATKAWRAAETLHADKAHPQRVLAAGAYGDALTLNGRAGEAVAVLEATAGLAGEIYGQENFRYARALDWLADALRFSGRRDEALTIAMQAYEIGTRAVPGNPLVPVWLHRVCVLLVDLRRPDEAAAFFAEQEQSLPAMLPQWTTDALDELELRIALARFPEDTDVHRAIHALVQSFQATRSAYLGPAQMLGIDSALAEGAMDRAGDLLEQQRALAEAVLYDDTAVRWLLLDARRRLQLGDDDAAIEQVRAAHARLDRIGHDDTTIRADADALLGTVLCRRGQVAEGGAALRRSRDFWRRQSVPPEMRAIEESIRRCAAGARIPMPS